LFDLKWHPSIFYVNLVLKLFSSAFSCAYCLALNRALLQMLLNDVLKKLLMFSLCNGPIVNVTVAAHSTSLSTVLCIVPVNVIWINRFWYFRFEVSFVKEFLIACTIFLRLHWYLTDFCNCPSKNFVKAVNSDVWCG